MCANNIPRRAGGIALGHFLHSSGRIEFEATIARLADDFFYLVCAADREIAAFDWLNNQHRKDERTEIINVSDDFCVVVLAGPQSREILSQTTGAFLDNESFPWLTAKTIQVAGAELLALRVSYAGELGWELHIPNAKVRSVYKAIVAAGRGSISHVGSLAFNCLRMEKAYPSGRELTNEVTLAEAGLLRFARLEKEYSGAAVNRAQTKSGPQKWALAYLQVDDAPNNSGDCADAEGGESVWRNGVVVGAVSSGGFGHCVGVALAFAYLNPESAAPGTELEILILGDKRRAHVLSASIFDPHNRRPRA